jgi:uncharacterized SAM-binding protein YcdF (DUF218 family)
MEKSTSPYKFGLRRRKKVVLVSLLSLAVWSLAAWALASALIVSEPLEKADAIVVLSGSATYVERTHRAAELYSEGRAPKIILTNDGQQGGWNNAQRRNPFFIERARDELLRLNVPAQAIEEIPQPLSNTHEEAVELRKFAASRGLRSLLIVTSAYHSRRARWTLRRVFEGSDVSLGMATAPTGEQTPRPALWWLFPSGWRFVGGEYVKFVYYRLSY